MKTITITVKPAHIAAAKPLPSYSPVALALQESGYADATVTHRYAYFCGNAYVLPDVAVNNEIRFDFLAKQGVIQGKVLEQIRGYSFELEVGR